MKTKTEENQFDNVHYAIDNEGFDYCFDGYSSWEEIEDEEFHRLRKEYLTAVNNLKNYIYERTDEEFWG